MTRQEQTIDKVVCIGKGKTCGGRVYSIYCHIRLAEGKLSISGVEGPLPSGNCLGSCGQINIGLKPSEIDLASGWTYGSLSKFFSIWKRFHLNDCRAGTVEQEAELDRHVFPGYPTNYYTWACEVLKAAGLYEVTHPITPEVQNGNGQFVRNTYKYGSAWLREEIPQDVIDFLLALPTTDKKYAWV